MQFPYTLGIQANEPWAQLGGGTRPLCPPTFQAVGI